MIEQELKQLDIFKGLPAEQVHGLAERSTSLQFDAGALINDGTQDGSDSIFLIVEGDVEVLHRDRNGSMIPVGQVASGGLIGEFSVIDGQHGDSQVRALRPTTLIAIPKDLFRSLVDEYGSVANHLLKDMVSIIRSLNERVASLQGAHSEFDQIRRDLFRFLV